MTVTINGTTGVTTPGVTNSGNETIAGTLQVGGVTTNVYPLVSGTSVASTSGTSIDFTSIPSWVKRVTVMLNGVSTNGTSTIQLQIGAGSVTTTGYISNAGAISGSNNTGLASSSTGLLFQISNTAAGNLSAVGVLVNMGSNVWMFTSQGYLTSPANYEWGTGSLSLGGTLDRVRITTVNGTDTFDAGSINILYE